MTLMLLRARFVVPLQVHLTMLCGIAAHFAETVSPKMPCRSAQDDLWRRLFMMKPS